MTDHWSSDAALVLTPLALFLVGVCYLFCMPSGRRHRARTAQDQAGAAQARGVQPAELPWSRSPDTEQELATLAAYCESGSRDREYENPSGSVVGAIVDRGTPEEQIAGLYQNLRSFWEEHHEAFGDMWRNLPRERRRNMLCETMPFILDSPNDRRTSIRGHNVSGLAALIPEATVDFMCDDRKGMLTIMQARASRPVSELEFEDWDHTIRVVLADKWKLEWGSVTEAEFIEYRRLAEWSGLPHERHGRRLINPRLPPHVKNSAAAEVNSRMMLYRTALRLYVENAGRTPLLRRFPTSTNQSLDYHPRCDMINPGPALQGLFALRDPVRGTECRELRDAVHKRTHALLVLLAGSADEYLTEIVHRRTGTVALPGHMGLSGVGLTEEQTMEWWEQQNRGARTRALARRQMADAQAHLEENPAQGGAQLLTAVQLLRSLPPGEIDQEVTAAGALQLANTVGAHRETAGIAATELERVLPVLTPTGQAATDVRRALEDVRARAPEELRKCKTCGERKTKPAYSDNQWRKGQRRCKACQEAGITESVVAREERRQQQDSDTALAELHRQAVEAEHNRIQAELARRNALEHTDDDCPICLEAVGTTERSFFGCKHWVCIDCLGDMQRQLARKRELAAADPTHDFHDDPRAMKMMCPKCRFVVEDA